MSCGQASPYYQKALEAKPNNVEALTGMGYCHPHAPDRTATLTALHGHPL